MSAIPAAKSQNATVIEQSSADNDPIRMFARGAPIPRITELSRCSHLTNPKSHSPWLGYELQKGSRYTRETPTVKLPAIKLKLIPRGASCPTTGPESTGRYVK